MNKLIAFLDENNVQYATYGNEHCREGWVQICCPFCISGDTDFHLGINLKNQYSSCYRCGWHSLESVIKAVTDAPYSEVKLIKAKLRGTAEVAITKTSSNKQFVLPSSASASRIPGALAYIQSRFPDRSALEVINKYDIRATTWDYLFECADGHKSGKYASSIVIPHIVDSRAVSFQCKRYVGDVHGYMTAKQDEELIPCKSMLWGVDRVPYGAVVVVEGAMCAMTIGDGAVHTYGVGFTPNQVQELAVFDTVYVLYDKDDAGCNGYMRLKSVLGHRTKVVKVTLSSKTVNDPNDLLKHKEDWHEVEEIRGLVN